MILTSYTYQKAVNLNFLNNQIRESPITVALDRIDYSDPDVIIWFKAPLSVSEESILTTIINNHDPSAYVPETELIQTEFKRVEDDTKIPYVYASPRPMNHYNYFTSVSDGTPTQEDPLQLAKGNQIIFDMSPTDVSKTVDLQFNEDVYLKDGMIFSKNAPFGASVDIDIYHPIYGYMLSFGKRVPVFGEVPIPMDTDDRASFSRGLIMRFVCYNSTGQNGHDAPASFKVLGRLELYRPKPAGT